MKNQNPKIFETKMVEKSTKYIDIFRKNIDMLMVEHDYTIKETAEIADISYDTLKTFLYDKEAKDCRLSTAVKLARAFNISIDELVGAGTFKPITADRLADHQMHSEVANLSEATVRTIEERKARGGRVFAIGTTSVRTLESAANALPDGSIDSTGLNPNRLAPFSGPTNLFIRPPYRFKVVDAMLTNFHLPKSTLVILVRTFGGDALLKRAYEEAIAEDYRFYSYGDAMLIV